MAEHGHSCGGGCGGCGSKQDAPAVPEIIALHPQSRAGYTLGICSGSGGTGKSLITGILAAELHKAGRRVGILDADITNPSIPGLFSIPQGVTRGDSGLYPALTNSGLKILSMGLLQEAEDEVFTTRGAVMAHIVQNLYSEVIWDELDFLLIDFPAGVWDVLGFCLHNIKLDGVLNIKTPGKGVASGAKRVHNLLAGAGVPVLGEVINFSEKAQDATDQLAYDSNLLEAADWGQIEALPPIYLKKTLETLLNL